LHRIAPDFKGLRLTAKKPINANFADTKVIIYSVSDDDDKRLLALKIIAAKPVISTQVLTETANTLQHKLKFSPQDTQSILMRLIAECDVVAVLPRTVISAYSNGTVSVFILR
jgi:predicted nucleic acid-binding protein